MANLPACVNTDQNTSFPAISKANRDHPIDDMKMQKATQDALHRMQLGLWALAVPPLLFVLAHDVFLLDCVAP